MFKPIRSSYAGERSDLMPSWRENHPQAAKALAISAGIIGIVGGLALLYLGINNLPNAFTALDIALKGVCPIVGGSVLSMGAISFLSRFFDNRGEDPIS